MMPQQYCLRWKYHHSNLQNMFSQLLDRGCFCDVTLACEGQTLKAHRVVLCACSTYFDSILTNCSIEKDPIIIMKDCKFADIKCLIEFMYKGEINVEHNNLASLLKTAEELRIKGLAEVSWRDEEENGDDGNKQDTQSKHNNKTNNNIDTTTTTTASYQVINGQKAGITPSAFAQISPDQQLPPLPVLAPLSSPRIIENGSPTPPPMKRKRGRPPLDSEYDSYSTPKISSVKSTSPFADGPNNLVSVMLDENSEDQHSKPDEEITWDEPNVDMQMDYEEELSSTRLIPKIERPDTPPDDIKQDPEYDPESCDELGASTSYALTPQEQEEFKDVIKMDNYLKTGRRPQFWEETFTRRVMEAIKTKDLEMKKAAKLLGVSYGTLYGRYRETYGCLKHPYRGPFTVSRYRDMWTEQGPAEIIALLQKGNITLNRAAELLNTSPSSLSGYVDQEWNTSSTGEREPSDQDDRTNTDNSPSIQHSDANN